jgi:hypothetical protein
MSSDLNRTSPPHLNERSTSNWQDYWALRRIVDAWVLYGDAGLWDEFAALWHSDGWMVSTWLETSAQEFVAARRRGFDKGVNVWHQLGGFDCKIVGERAVAQTKMTIIQRAEVHGVLCDATCMGRFFDFFERRNGRWGLVRRQPIYERDRLDPVVSGEEIVLDTSLLKSFPEGYRHLAYLQTVLGFTVRKTGLPGTHGAEVEALYLSGEAWLNR